MSFLHSPSIFVACLFGLTLLVAMALVCFYITRHRRYIVKPHDPEPGVDYMGMAAGEQEPPRFSEIQHHHPPVYCVDDLQYPPPTYEAVFTRNTAPTPHEMHALRRRLEKLQRRQRRNTTAGTGSSRQDTTSGCETAIRDSEIRCLRQWIERLDTLRDEEEEEEEEEVHDGRWRASSSHPRRTMRLVHSQSEPAVLPTRAMTIQRETGWINCGLPREVAPPYFVPPPSPTLTETMDARFAELREQIMRGMGGRHSLSTDR